MTNVEAVKFGNKVTPQQALLGTLNEATDMDCVVIVYVDREGYIRTSWSNSSMLKRLGMMQVASNRMIELAQED